MLIWLLSLVVKIDKSERIEIVTNEVKLWPTEDVVFLIRTLYVWDTLLQSMLVKEREKMNKWRNFQIIETTCFGRGRDVITIFSFEKEGVFGRANELDPLDLGSLKRPTKGGKRMGLCSLLNVGISCGESPTCTMIGAKKARCNGAVGSIAPCTADWVAWSDPNRWSGLMISCGFLDRFISIGYLHQEFCCDSPISLHYLQACLLIETPSYTLLP